MIPAGFKDMKATTKACGLPASKIRMWEARYGWPKPRRLPNGYRIYSVQLVEQLTEVAAIVKDGKVKVESLIDKDGNITIVRPDRLPIRPVLKLANGVPEPTTIAGKALRTQLLLGFKNGEPGKVRMAIASVLLVHPNDRAAACFAPACAAIVDLEQEQKQIKELSIITRELDEAMGGDDVLRDTMETFRKFAVLSAEIHNKEPNAQV